MTEEEKTIMCCLIARYCMWVEAHWDTALTLPLSRSKTKAARGWGNFGQVLILSRRCHRWSTSLCCHSARHRGIIALAVGLLRRCPGCALLKKHYKRKIPPKYR